MVPTILTIIIIIVAIIGLVTLARALFFSGSSSSNQTQVDANKQALLDSSDGSAVSMTVRGPIVADENFRSYQIIVSPTSREMKTYTGYLDAVLKQDSFDNNVTAYEQFVHALDKANMSAGRQLSDEKNDVRGVCATGRVYEFSTLKNGDAVQTLWTSTCSGSQGSLKASATQLSQLFQKQIPTATSLLSGLSL
jgi:hypothetical protein